MRGIDRRGIGELVLGQILFLEEGLTVRSIRLKLLTSSALCFGPFAAAAAYDIL